MSAARVKRPVVNAAHVDTNPADTAHTRTTSTRHAPGAAPAPTGAERVPAFLDRHTAPPRSA
ncbi:hypothetical protein [Streptomyces sp. NPDC057336]|uniref:hypothetical protein n=1 Tax=Streptomyces sp. NPDC057336 TaxID=3346102 RepID=UPI0036303CB4